MHVLGLGTLAEFLCLLVAGFNAACLHQVMEQMYFSRQASPHCHHVSAGVTAQSCMHGQGMCSMCACRQARTHTMAQLNLACAALLVARETLMGRVHSKGLQKGGAYVAVGAQLGAT